MVKAIVALWVMPPPVAFTVTLVVPVVAGAAIEVGLKLAVTPAGSPEADNEIAELNPPLTVVEIVLLPDAP
jgi:hypothetical protein